MTSRRTTGKHDEGDPLDAVPAFDRGNVAGSPRGMRSIICTRCGGGFIVVARRWRESKFKTRPCPYCFKVSKP